MADAREVIHNIVALEPEGGSKPYKKITPEQGDQIARFFGGDFSLFADLDERPGLFVSPWYHGVEGVYDYNMWHWKLRQARNDVNNNFFAILTGTEEDTCLTK